MNSRSYNNFHILFCDYSRDFDIFDNTTKVIINSIFTSRNKKTTSKSENLFNNYNKAFFYLSLFIF